MASSADRPSASASRWVTYSSTTPSTPRPNSIAEAPVAAADSVAPENPSSPSTMSSDKDEGSAPMTTSQALRKMMKSSGRISASEPTPLTMLSRLTTASASSAMR